MALFYDDRRTVSVTDASARGISALVRDAQSGDVIVEKRGRPVAAVVAVKRLEEIAELEADLRSAALVLSRAATDDGYRTDLTDVVAALGFDRKQLESELDAELAAEKR